MPRTGGRADPGTGPACPEGGVKRSGFPEEQAQGEIFALGAADTSYPFPLYHHALKVAFSAEHFCPEMSQRIQISFFEASEAKRKDCLQPSVACLEEV